MSLHMLPQGFVLQLSGPKPKEGQINKQSSKYEMERILTHINGHGNHRSLLFLCVNVLNKALRHEIMPSFLLGFLELKI